jgi:hypothetical protein
VQNILLVAIEQLVSNREKRADEIIGIEKLDQ